MPILNQDETIKGYFNEIKDKYPNLDFNTIERICKVPFLGIKEWIASGVFPIIKIKYLGELVVSKKKLRDMLKLLFHLKNRGKIDENEYNVRTAYYKKYLNDLDNMNKAKENANNIIFEDDAN